MKDTNYSQYIKVIGIVAALIMIGIVLLAFKPFTIIQAGERGVVMHFGKVDPQILSEGLHWYLPISTTVKVLSVRVQKSDVSAAAASKDLQDVRMEIVVNWHVNPSMVNKLYQQVGDETDVFEKIISPSVSEVAKAAGAKLTAEEIIKERPQLKKNIDDELKKRLAAYSVVLDDVSLVNLSFSPEFNAAIEAKQVAEQQAKQAQFVADKATKDAEARVNQAKGEAEAQRLQQQTITAELLQKMAIEKWNGQFPQYFGGGALPFINIGK